MKKKTQIIIVAVILILAIIGLVVGLHFTKDTRVENQKLLKNEVIEISIRDKNGKTETIGNLNIDNLKKLNPVKFENNLKTNGKDPIKQKYTGIEFKEIFKKYNINTKVITNIQCTASDIGKIPPYGKDEIMQDDNFYIAYEVNDKPFSINVDGRFVVIPTKDSFSNRRCKKLVKIEIQTNVDLGQEKLSEAIKISIKGKNGKTEIIGNLNTNSLKRLDPVEFENDLKTSGKDSIKQIYTGVLLKTILEKYNINPNCLVQVNCDSINNNPQSYDKKQVLENDNLYIAYELAGKPYPFDKGGRFVVIPTKDAFSNNRCKWLVKIEIQTNVDLGQEQAIRIKTDEIDKNLSYADITKMKSTNFDNNYKKSGKDPILENYDGIAFSEIVDYLGINTSVYKTIKCTAWDNVGNNYLIEKVMEPDNYYIAYKNNDNVFTFKRNGRYVLIPSKEKYSQNRCGCLVKIEFVK